MNTEESNDPAWELLRRRSAPAVKPDFLAGLMRSIQDVPQDSARPETNIVPFPSRKWALGLGSLAAAAAVVFGLYVSFKPVPVSLDVPAPIVDVTPSAVNPSLLVDDSLEQEFAAVQDMHTLIAVEDPSQLDDAQLIALLN
jgi:hypothetical protein